MMAPAKYRIFAIGDIHGHYEKLSRLLTKIEAKGLRPEDRLVFVGDYVDRGPKTPAVLDALIELKEARPNSVFLRGNHDQGMLDARDAWDPARASDYHIHEVEWWFNCGGQKTIDAYPKHDPWYESVPPEHWQFLESTQFELRAGNFLFVHAGIVPPGKSWRQPEDPRLWIREEFIGSKANFGFTVIFGHTPQDLFMPIVMNNKVGIDTGAAYGGPLTAVCLDPESRYPKDMVEFISSN